MSWHVYSVGEAVEANVGGQWQPATFVDEIMPPSHKSVIELAGTGARVVVTRDQLRPTSPARGRVS